MKINKRLLKNILHNATGCTIQHTGWTCGTCFFSISEKLNNQDWQSVLLIRGDYKKTDLDNLPQDIEKSIQKVVKLCLKN